MIDKNRVKKSESEFGLERARVGFVAVFVMAMVALGLTLISLRLLGMPVTHAEMSINTQTAITVTSSCEMTSVVDTAHEATVTASTYEDEIGETTITVACNDANGYAIYAVGFTNDELGRNDLLGQTTGRTIATGTATSGNTSAWAMKLAAVDNSVAPTIVTGYDDYHAVPGESTRVASFADSTMTNPAGSSFKTTYATYVESLQAPDVYIGKVKYTLVHPADTPSAPCSRTYTIIYNRNGGTGGMDSQTACVDRGIGLLPNEFTAPAPVTENQFAAWNTAPDGSGYTYYPGQNVMNLASAGGSVTLYAQWAPKYIQDLTPLMCQMAASDNPLTVYDKRDGSDYTVRYIQGACWMTQNLRITGTVYAQNSNFSTYSNVNVCEQDLTAGNSYDTPRCHDSGNDVNGIWYNYAAATAKTITGNPNTALATEDICPANWHLPSYDTTNPAGSVNSLLLVPTASVVEFAPATGGFYHSGQINNVNNGYWWTTTTYSSNSRYGLSYAGGNLSTSSYYTGDGGLFIRCVRKASTIDDVVYMQDVTSEMVENMEEGDTASLTDRRDGNIYTLAKLQGALWMTQNLRITGTVSSQGSNFSTYSSVDVCEEDLTAGNDGDQPRCHISNNDENGVWYNYAAASAKTIIGDSNVVDATEDICPANWHLPTYDSSGVAGSMNSLLQSSSVTLILRFSPVAGGWYASGTNSGTSGGYWWTAAARDSQVRYNLGYSGGAFTSDTSRRWTGVYIRCVHT